MYSTYRYMYGMKSYIVTLFITFYLIKSREIVKYNANLVDGFYYFQMYGDRLQAFTFLVCLLVWHPFPHPLYWSMSDCNIARHCLICSQYIMI